MKLLWIKTDFLHPTTRGGQIRTLETLRRLHARHEVHYLAYSDPGQPEGVDRSGEYCTRAYPVPRIFPPRRSAAFMGEAVGNLFSSLPLSVARYRSAEFTREVERLTTSERFDCIVCDFLFPAPNIRNIERCVLFQHNVESMIWQRHVKAASNPAARYYMSQQASRMEAYERQICRTAGHVIAVSTQDAETMRSLYGCSRITAVPTGVDIEYFAPTGANTESTSADLVFVGSMDWMPNIDGMRWFWREVFPLILRERPQTSLAIVGRTPSPEITAWAGESPRVVVTGTVPDVRPWLWGAKVSIVPLRIGGGTRLKIYEAMAARAPVVSTTIGAEGLAIRPPHNIRLADSAEAFAKECLQLLASEPTRSAIADDAWCMVAESFSWEAVTREFESVLALPATK